MKVILLQDVPNIGQKYEVVNVKDGFARNALIPQKKAVFASDKVMAELERQRLETQTKRKEQEQALTQTLESINGKQITIPAKVNEKGHLFSSVTAETIAEEIEKQLSTTIPADAISLPQPIKEAGEHTVGITGGKSGASVVVAITSE